jgi:hypothetical protein
MRRGELSPSANMSKDRNGTCAQRVTPHLPGCRMTSFCALQVAQKAAPSRGGRARASQQVPPDCGLADIDAELEQFVVDARCAQNGLAELIPQTRSRISALVLGRSAQRDRHRQ